MNKGAFAKIGKAAKGTVKEEPVAPQPIKKQTLYLPRSVWRNLRQVSTDMEISQQEIFRQSLDMWFAENGLPSWQEMVSGAVDDEEN